VEASILEFFTHLFFGSAVVWVLLGVLGVKGEFLLSPARKASFLIVMLGAIIADFDVFIPNSHRLYTHSLVFPLVAVILGIVLWKMGQVRIAYTISFAFGFQWAVHILLDLGSFPPMGLLWPLWPFTYAIHLIIVNGSGDIPQALFLVFVFTPQEWNLWGKMVFEDPVWTIPFGVSLLAFLLFMLTVVREFRSIQTQNRNSYS
jgi:membrane-bound metal-dependent hydrolase YbcI (DUF457 family)